MSGDKHVAFSISAGCYFYQLGIAYYIQKHFNLTNVKFSGASGGGWPALLLAAGEDVKHGFEHVIQYAPECAKNRPVMGAYMVYDRGIRLVFDKLFGDVDLKERVRGRLGLSVTRLAWGTLPYLKDEFVTEFYSNEDVCECIIASALIPFALNGRPYVIYRGWICADGGITNVTGVRHMAEELVHDIEMIEEGIVEQAHRLSDTLLQPLEENEEEEGHPHDSAPMSSGRHNILRFAYTVTGAIGHLVKDRWHRRHEKRRQRQANTANICHSSLSKVVDSLGLVGGQGACGGGFSFRDTVASIEELYSRQRSWIPDLSCNDPTEDVSLSSQEKTTDNDDDDVSYVQFIGSNALESNIDDEHELGRSHVNTKSASQPPSLGTVVETSASSHSRSNSFSSLSDDGTGEKISTMWSPESGGSANHISATSSSTTSVVRPDGITRDGVYWSVKSQCITRLPNGDMQLEVSPWMWRHHSLLNYHLSADPNNARRLFDMGLVDACEHHWELMKFFDPDAYKAMMMNK